MSVSPLSFYLYFLCPHPNIINELNQLIDLYHIVTVICRDTADILYPYHNTIKGSV